MYIKKYKNSAKVRGNSLKDEASIVNEAVAVLKKGGMIVYPTETCYGVGVDATNQKAVERLMQYKSRPFGKPISVIATGLDMARKYITINEIAQNLYENYLPGPITIISKVASNSLDSTFARGVISQINTVGVRVPDYMLILKIAEKFGKPFTATSANITSQPTPYSIETLFKYLSKERKNMLDFVIDAGKLPFNKPSTVVDTTLNNINIMRDGTVQLQKAVGYKTPILQAKTEGSGETVDFGSLNMLKFAKKLANKCVIFLLSGELGVGKTQFTKGLAHQLGIKQIVKSPTFNLVSEYTYNYTYNEKSENFADKQRKDVSIRRFSTDNKLIHIDTWRLENVEALKQLRIDRQIQPGNVIVVEWADKFYAELVKLFQGKDSFLVNVIFEYASSVKSDGSDVERDDREDTKISDVLRGKRLIKSYEV